MIDVIEGIWGDHQGAVSIADNRAPMGPYFLEKSLLLNMAEAP